MIMQIMADLLSRIYMVHQQKKCVYNIYYHVVDYHRAVVTYSGLIVGTINKRKTDLRERKGEPEFQVGDGEAGDGVSQV